MASEGHNKTITKAYQVISARRMPLSITLYSFSALGVFKHWNPANWCT